MIESFSSHEEIDGRSTRHALGCCFQDHGKFKPAQGRNLKPVIILKAKTPTTLGKAAAGGKNPSDPDAGCDRLKGAAYQHLLAHSYRVKNEVHLVTH